MKFVDALASETEARRGTECLCCRMVVNMTPEDQAAFGEALASPASTTLILRALKKSGHDISGSSLQRHRRKECRGLR